MMLSSIIVEDVLPSADMLRQFCEKTGKIAVKASCGSAEQALEFLSQNNVDLIFLDVEIYKFQKDSLPKVTAIWNVGMILVLQRI